MPTAGSKTPRFEGCYVGQRVQAEEALGGLDVTLDGEVAAVERVAQRTPAVDHRGEHPWIAADRRVDVAGSAAVAGLDR